MTAVLGGLFLLGAMAQHPWLIGLFAVIGVVAGFGYWALRPRSGVTSSSAASSSSGT